MWHRIIVWPGWRYSVVFSSVVAFSVIVFFLFTSPVLPYSKFSLYVIDKILNPTQAGSLNDRDIVVTFNNQPFLWCMYFVDSPIYFAPRDTPIPLEYRTPPSPEIKTTTIELADPSPRQLLNRSLAPLVGVFFLITGILLVASSGTTYVHWTLGAASLSSAILIVAGPEISDFNAPLSLFFWWNIPIWAFVLTISHSLWPVNQLNRRSVWILLIGVGIIGLANFGMTFAGATWFGCYTNLILLYGMGYSQLLLFTIPLPVMLYLLTSAYRTTANPFSRLQIRAIAWSVGIGLGTPLILSLIPNAFGAWAAPIEITLMVAGIVPITYFFVLYRSDLMLASRYLNRVVFVFLFLMFWGIITLLITNALLYWFSTPDPFLIALVAALPPLLAATFVRERLGLLVDLVLYGTHYDSEAVIAQIGANLTGVLTEDALAQVAIIYLPQALSIRAASFWLVEGQRLRLIKGSTLGDTLQPKVLLADLPMRQAGAVVEVFNTPLMLLDHPWRVALRLHMADKISGIVLLGEKLREQVYSEQDVRVLATLSGMLTTALANVAAMAEQKRLLLALVENDEKSRQEVAEELHDNGISPLALLRRMVDQQRPASILVATIDRIIDDMRLLSQRRLSPVGADQGLTQALVGMAQRYAKPGLLINIEAEESVVEQLAPLTCRELFYIAQEAVVNATKHAQASQVVVQIVSENNLIRMLIADNGSGFDATSLKNRPNRGLGIMRARVNRIGGQVEIISEKGHGTEVCVLLNHK